MKKDLFLWGSAFFALGYVSFASAAALTATCKNPVVDIVDSDGNHHMEPAPGSQKDIIQVSVLDDWSKAHFSINNVDIPLDLPCNTKEAGKDFVCQMNLDSGIPNDPFLFSFIIDTQNKISFRGKGKVFEREVELIYECAAQN